MDKYITLIGAEEVNRAAGRMQSAADDMSRVVGSLDEVLSRNRQYMDEWLSRFEEAITAWNQRKEGGDGK